MEKRGSASTNTDHPQELPAAISNPLASGLLNNDKPNLKLVDTSPKPKRKFKKKKTDSATDRKNWPPLRFVCGR
jgi:hypothetical protein